MLRRNMLIIALPLSILIACEQGTQPPTAPQGMVASGGDRCPTLAFNIDVKFVSLLRGDYRLAVLRAADRWENVVIRDKLAVDFANNPYSRYNDHLKRHVVVNEWVDDMLIVVGARPLETFIASARVALSGSRDGLPVVSTIVLDQDDLDQYTPDQVERTILHEIGHCLGIGSNRFQSANFVKGTSIDPYFTGINAQVFFHMLLRWSYSIDRSVPIETDKGHWRTSVIGDELMTGRWHPPYRRPLSLITIGALEDLGHGVNYDAAEHYDRPSSTSAKPTEIALTWECGFTPTPARTVAADGQVLP